MARSRCAVTAWVDSTLVARLIWSLVRNGVQHAPQAQRWVYVSGYLLEVGDDGPGIPPAERAHVLEAFRRGAASQGHGLGLAIVALHGGSLSLSEPPGLVVSVRFPPRPSTPLS